VFIGLYKYSVTEFGAFRLFKVQCLTHYEQMNKEH